MKEPTARAARRRALGLGALASLWVFIGRSAARAADALTINPNGEVSVDKLSVTQSLAVAGPATISGKNTLEFGAGVTGKQTDAGKIGYQTFSDALDIVGAGPQPTDSTKPGPRKIKFWAEGGATLDGSSPVSGNVATASVTGKGALPVGAILMWSGDPAKLPAGWVLCDGGNKTPDLLGRFIVGYHPAQPDYDRISNVGGEERHKLEVNEIPDHKHPLGDRIEYIANHTHR